MIKNFLFLYFIFQSNIKPSKVDTTYTNEFFLIINWGIKLYRKIFSAKQADVCHFTPSCSHYGSEAIKKYGIKGILMTMDKLQRCHPLAWRYNNKYYTTKFVKDRGYKLYDPIDNKINTAIKKKK